MVKVLFLTGAGVSANAGLETYRSVGSSWTDQDLEKKSHASRYGNHLDELWDKHWGPLSRKISEVEPTHTHKRIAEFNKSNPGMVVTQNIDTLHEDAGSDNVVHLHGCMNTYCIRCRIEIVSPWQESGAPVCFICKKKRTRPNVVLFGEKLNQRILSSVGAFAKNDADVIIAIGTSLNVFPAAYLVSDNITKSIIVNKESTVFDKHAYKVFNSDCDTVIDEILGSL